jgi:hypothetical protein
MTILKNVFEAIRATLEVGYYAAGITLAYLAYRGLAQIKLTKDLATTNAKREAFRLAIERCHFYADEVVPARAKIIALAKAAGISFAVPPSFKVRDGEIVDLDVRGRNTFDEALKLEQDLLAFLNKLEAFALAFTVGVADEAVGYRETALAFCQAVRETIAYVDLCRRNRTARYESTIQLFELWNNRMIAESLRKQKQRIDDDLQGIKQTKITPLGTE